MTSRFDHDRHLQEEADAAEERRVAEQVRHCQGCGGELEPGAVPLLCGDWHASCAEAEFATEADDGRDPDPHDWRRDRQERIDREHEEMEERRR